MILKNLRELKERLEEKIEKIPAYKSCVNNKVPEGRVWCDYYNQIPAGRCKKSCKRYKDKFLEKVA